MLERLRELLTRSRVGYAHPGWEYAGLSRMTSAGQQVNADTALHVPAVYSCVSLLTRTIATLGCGIYKVENGTRILDEQHPLHYLLNISPDGEMSAHEWWETITADMLLWGKGYAIIERNDAAQPVALRIVHPSKVDVRAVNGQRMYVCEGMSSPIFNADMFVLRWLYNTSPIESQKTTIGLALAAQQFASAFFAGKGNMLGILSFDQPLKKEQMEQLRESWNRDGGELGTKMLPFGGKYNRISVDPQAAQTLESRRHADEAICTAFGVPPALVQIQTGTTYSNTEQQNLHFAQHTIAPLAKRIESEVAFKLVSERDRGYCVPRVDMRELYRGDLKTRAEYFTQMMSNGAMSINEVRKQEDMQPTPGGDVLRVQVNQIALDRFDEYSAKISTENQTNGN